MYKLLLVDDEEEVRKGILQKIEWEKYGFEISGEAENGKEALEIAERVVPDVVLTDIKMPFMDGLALSEMLKEKFPTTKVVILTGFDEFEFARRAVKLDVVEYVLKPVSSKELIDILLKVKARIDEEIVQKEDMQLLREYYKKSLPLLKEKFLASLVTRRLKASEISEKSRIYGINLRGSGFVASVLSIDYGTVATGASMSLSPAPLGTARLYGQEDTELLNFAVLNISEEIVDRHSLGLVFLHHDSIVVLSALMEEDRDTVMDKTLAVMEEIRQSVEKYLRFTVTIGVGDVCRSIDKISTSHKNAVSALDYRLILGSNRVVCIGDVEPKRLEKVVFDELKQHSLESCIKVGTSREIRKTVDELFGEIIDSKAAFKDYQLFLLEMLTTILRVAKDLDVDMDDVFGPSYNLFVEMYKFKDIQEVKDWISGICNRIVGYVSKDRQDTCKLLVKTAREYAQSHYHESDITITKVCRHLHISPAYFSTIFKRETKMTFINYLTQIRMDAAKELLRSTDMKSFEIAEKVGFSEPNYFSYSFKKNFGISPSEYRNQP